jgi:hypothetical protein
MRVWAFAFGGTILVACLGCVCLAAADAQSSFARAARTASSPGGGSARMVALPAAKRRRSQSVLFWLGWDRGKLGRIPWKAVTQVDLFSLATCVKAGDPAPDCTGPTSLSQQFNGVTHPRSFVRMVHGHRKLAMISIGGSTNPNWYYACNPSDVTAFAAKLVAFMKSNGFDGIDLDIEQDPGAGNPVLTATDLRTCTETVYRDAKATRTSRGRRPLISSDVDPTTNFEIGRLQAGYVDQFNAMSYGVHGSKLAAQISALETKSGIAPRDITAGLDIGDYRTSASQCGGTARLARRKHLAGTMLWYGQADAPRYSCLRAIAHNLR